MFKILNLIIGRSGTGKTFEIYKLIKNKIEKGKEVIFLVPEQKSFYSEYELLKFLGEFNFKKLKILTFKRLLDFVYKFLGYPKNKILNGLDKSIIISNIIDDLCKKNILINKNLNLCDNLNIICEVIEKYKENNIKKINNINDKNLENKLNDIKLIINKYEKNIKNNFNDPVNELTAIYKILKKYNFFNNFTIFIDDFTFFTYSQFNILKLMIKESEIYFSFKCNPDFNSILNNDETISWQYYIKKTINKILDIAKKLGFKKIKIKEKSKLYIDSRSKEISVFYMNETKRFKSLNLKILEKNLFEKNLNIEIFEINQTFSSEDIFLYKATDIYDERDFVARNIKNLVMNKGYMYKDFLIITRNIDEYKDSLDTVFKDYNIPYFLDYPDSLFYKNIMIIASSITEVLITNFSSEEIFRYLKTQLTCIEFEDILLIEDYCFHWNIDNDIWLEDFTFLLKNSKDEDIEKLKYINKIRERIIKPFLNFKKKINKNKNIIKSFYEFLIEIKLPENIKKFCENIIKNSENNNKNKTSKMEFLKEQIRLWDMLIDFLDRINSLFLNKKIDLKSFNKYLNIFIKNENISFIPNYDEVVITSVDRMKISNCKIIFIVGASKNKFPLIKNKENIFNNNENKKLNEMGFKFSESIEEICSKELFFIYSSLTIASEKLFISWQTSGEENNSKSEIANIILKIFPKIKIISSYNLSIDEFLWTKKNAFDFLIKNNKNKENLSEYYKKIIEFLIFYFKNDKKYIKKIEFIKLTDTKSNFNFKDDKTLINFLNNKIIISPTQIEKFYSCEFAYFCQYILKIKKNNRIQINSPEHGSIVHFSLESFLKNYLNTIVDKNKRLKIINNLIIDYTKFYFGDFKKQNIRFKYLTLRKSNFINFLINNIENNLKKSNFNPKYYEFEIFEENKFNNKIKSSISGKIDRIDIMNDDKNNYCMLVDYKTGYKKFNLSDIYYGINIQMMIYLKVIKNNIICNNTLPSGFLFLPAIKPTIEIDEKKINIEEKLKDKLNMYGLILNNDKILNEIDGIKLKNDKYNSKNYILNVNEFNILYKYMDFIIINMLNKIEKGDFKINPVCKNGVNYCSYCDYHSICRKKENQFKIIKTFEKEEILKMMDESTQSIK